MAKIKGNNKNNVLKGTSANDVLLGLGGDDNLKGNKGNDKLKGGEGNDTLSGGAGTDTAQFTGQSKDYEITKTSNGYLVKDKVGTDGTDTVLSDIEFLQFADGKFSLTEAKSFTLTTGPDNFVGSFIDDTFTGNVSTETALFTTFSSGDILDGAGGSNDTLKVVVSGNVLNSVTTGGTVLSNIENVFISNSAVQFFDASFWTGVTRVGVDSSTASSYTEFDNLSDLVTVELKGNQGDLSVYYSGALLDGTSDVQNVVLSNNVDGFLIIEDGAGNTAETLNILSQTGANVLTINGTNTYATLNVTGSTHLDLDVDGTSLTTIDASGMTGGGVAVYGVGDSDLAFTGSGSDDRVVLDNDSLDGSDTIAGGGGNDLLGFNNGAAVSNADLANVTSVEIIAAGSGLLTSTLGTGAFAAGITTVSAFNDARLAITVDAPNFTRALTVNLDAADPGDSPSDANDLVDGGSMSQKLVVTALASHVDSLDTLTAGTNTADELQLKADSGSGADLSTSTFFEKLTVLAGAKADDDISIVTGDTTVDSGVTFVVTAAALTNSGAQLFFDGSAETDGKFSITGGAGKDQISGGDGDDTIDGGTNDDILFANQGNDLLKGNTGNDRFGFLSTELDGNDEVQGGSGTDTLVIGDGGSVSDTDFTKITSVEVIATKDALEPELSLGDNALQLQLDSLAKAAGVNTVVGAGTNNDTIQIGSGFTSAITVEIAGGDDSVISSSTAALTVVAEASEVDAADTLTGGTGSGDVLKLEADGGTAFLGAKVTGFETVTVVAGDPTDSDIQIITSNENVGAGSTLVVNAAGLTNPNAEMTFDGSAELDGKFNITGGNGADDIVGGSGNDTISGGSGNDTIDGGADGEESLSGGSGDDTFVFTIAGLTTADKVDGGAHSAGDVLRLTGAGGTVDDTKLTGVVNVEILDGSMLAAALIAVLGTEAYNGGAGLKTVIGSFDNDSVTIGSAFSGAITVDIGDGGSDKVSAAGSTATVTIVSGAMEVSASDTLTGGSGSGDTLKLTADNATANLSGVTGFEKLTVVADSGNDISVVLGADSVVTGGKTFVVDAKALTDGGVFSFDGSAETVPGGGDTVGKFDISGGSGDDTLAGGAGVDTIVGGAGDDHIMSGIGNDSIDAGIGDDNVYVVGTYTVGAVTATSNGADVISLGTDGDFDYLHYDLSLAVAAAATITDFDAATSADFEDRVEVSSVFGFSNTSNTQVQSTAAGAVDAALVILDNKSFTSLSDAAAQADNLHDGVSAGGGAAYIFLWADASDVHVSYATVDILGDVAQDQFVDLAVITNYSLADLQGSGLKFDLSDFILS